jgi:hypothetical protein
MVFMFFTSVLYTCFKCFIFLQTYILNVTSACFKSRWGVAHVAMRPTCHSHLQQLLGHQRASADGEGGTSGPRAWSSSAGDIRATRALRGRAKCRRAQGQSTGARGKRSADGGRVQACGKRSSGSGFRTRESVRTSGR